MERRTSGLTILELVVVLAILGVLGAIGVVTVNALARGQAARGAVATFQQSVWQGATAAAARGITVVLVVQDGDLVLQNESTGARLRSFDLPNSVDIPVSNPILRFLPPGKVDLATLDALPEDLVIDTGEGRYRLEISLIGEVRSTRLGAS